MVASRMIAFLLAISVLLGGAGKDIHDLLYHSASASIHEKDSLRFLDSGNSRSTYHDACPGILPGTSVRLIHAISSLSTDEPSFRVLEMPLQRAFEHKESLQSHRPRGPPLI